MKKIVAVVCCAALGMTGLALPSKSASADTPGCVSKREYRNVHRGMVKPRVHRIFDTRGWFVDGGAGGYARGYRICDAPAWKVIVVYDATHRRHRLWSKKTMRMRTGAFEGITVRSRAAEG